MQTGCALSCRKKPDLRLTNGPAVQKDGTLQQSLSPGAKTGDPHLVGFVHLKPRMHQGVGQGTVIGQQQQSL